MTRKKCPYCTFDPETHIETDFPDNECYERTYTHTVIEYCPKCGRNLRDEKEQAVKP